MLVHQPFFIGGIENYERAKGSAFGAAATFFLVFLISIVYLIADAQYGGFQFGNSGLNNPRSPRSRGDRGGNYDLVSLVQEYHADDEDESGELGQFT